MKRSHLKKPFMLPTGKAKGPVVPIYTFNSVSQESSERRVLAATPSLSALYQFLEESAKRVP